ncbi:DNA-binding transcriptional regulator, ArsR family [Nonomuraea jiangxiensis]|uniref:DNA-binding transcriptional regulator, ArsR family n=2 Tax=Nonomuraea jiangxiensis TaxID=633440 RepID=A0A1G9HYK5_9ACTN|nr:DNA-binding transcriptional regulator, ArsR family [Nonomuraea jiangxiensis]
MIEQQRCDLLCLDLPYAEDVRAGLPDTAEIAAAAARARALADASRLRIALALQAGGAMCVWDLAWVCDLAQNLVSHHLRALRTAGLATSRRERKLVIYSLTDTGRTLLAALMGTSVPTTPR